MSRERVLVGVEGEFTQADHGRATILKKISKGNLIVFYSPRPRFRDGEPLQKFTAIGRIVGEKSYQVEMSRTFHPWRRRVSFLSCEAPCAQSLLLLLFPVSQVTTAVVLLSDSLVPAPPAGPGEDVVRRSRHPIQRIRTRSQQISGTVRGMC